ncbi:hypothetical protein PG996_006858 [Apiospora saccharicola]|uniref:Uncharacterized protein n=1 Tax=Apiospora saccharicola TaxID=335842 RepID=A0ABR1VBM8_9PEZI
MAGPPSTSEPKVGWIRDAGDMGWSSGSHNTSDIRHQLGVTAEHASLDSRGILSLDPEGPFSEPIYNSDYAGFGILNHKSKVLALLHPLDTPNGDGVIYYRADDIHTAIFQDILNTTSNPAFALQALSTMMNQMQIFKTAYQWTYGYPATYVFSGEFSIPKRYSGLLIVASLIAAHVALTGATIAMFLLRTRATLLGNAWQSVAQVVSDRTLKVLWRVDSLNDKEVKKALSSATGDPEIPAGAIRRRRNGRNEYGSVASQ